MAGNGRDTEESWSWVASDGPKDLLDGGQKR